MPIRPSDFYDSLSDAIAQYLSTSSEVLKRVDHLLMKDYRPEPEAARNTI